jgi:hypothetical protein
VADDLAKRAERQQRRHKRNLVDIDHPDHICRTDMQIRSNGGQRDVGDRGIQRRHPQRGEDRRHCPASPFRRQAVHHRRARLLRRDGV